MAHHIPPSNYNPQVGSGMTTMQMWQGYPQYSAPVYGSSYGMAPPAPQQDYYQPYGGAMTVGRPHGAMTPHTQTHTTPGGYYGMAQHQAPPQPRYDMTGGGYEGVRYGTEGPPKKKQLTNAAAISSATGGFHSTSVPTNTSNNRSAPTSASNGGGSGAGGASSGETDSNNSSAWPPSLVAYVTRCFQKYTDPEDVAILEKKLAEMVKLAKESQTIWSRDWSVMPLPVITRPTLDPSTKAPNSKVQFSMSGSTGAKGATQKSHLPGNNSFSGPASSSPAKSKKQKKQANSDEDEDSEEKRLARANRFKAKSSESPRPSQWSSSSSSSSSYTGESLQQEYFDGGDAPLVGTSTALEKAYFRLIERPQVSSVRPVHILKQSLALMRDKKAKGGSESLWKSYLGEQMKSIRQDLVIQAVNDEFTLEVYETNARWCLEYDDLAEFKRCLLRINEFYNHLDLTSPNHLEFATYSLIYNILSEDFPSLNKELSLLPREMRSQASLKHAIKLSEAYVDNNWALFFSLSKTTFFLEQHILQVAAERLRIHALKSIFISYRPTVPIEWLGTHIGLPNLEGALAWFSDHGCAYADRSRTSLDAKDSLKGLLEWESKNKPGK